MAMATTPPARPDAEKPRLLALATLFTETSRLRASRRLAIALSALTSIEVAGIVLTRVIEGPEGFVDGAVARMTALTTLLVGMSLSLDVAGAGARGLVDAGAWSLAELRGFRDDEIERAAIVSSLFGALRRALALIGAVGLLAAVLSLPSATMFGRRVLVAALSASLGVVGVTALLLLAQLLHRAARRRGKVALVSLLVVPWVVAGLVPGVPPEASLPGVFEALLDQIMWLAP